MDTELSDNARIRGAQATLRTALTAQADAKYALDLLLHNLESVLEPLQKTLAQCKELVGESETILRDLLIQHHVTTGEAKVPGVGMVKRSRTIHYTPSVALAWAQEHRLFLQLNVKAFEQFCLAQSEDALPSGVTMVSTWKAEIDRKSL